MVSYSYADLIVDPKVRIGMLILTALCTVIQITDNVWYYLDIGHDLNIKVWYYLDIGHDLNTRPEPSVDSHFRV